MQRRAGLALIVIVGILGILCVLTVAFATLARLERKASQQRIHTTRAFFLARSGMEDALARLSSGQDPLAAESRWGGADLDADGLLAASETAQYETAAAATDPPARKALRPTWAAFASSGGVPNPQAPIQQDMERFQRGYSGRLAGNDRGTYSLKVSPADGIHVNGGDPAQAASIGYNAVLRRILGVLAEALQHDEGQAVTQADGFALIDLRPTAGWRNLDEIRTVLGWDDARIEAFRPYLAFRAWTDKRVIVPNAKTALPIRYASWGNLKRDRNPGQGGDLEPDFERMPPGTGRIVGRAPVSLVWAVRHRPALVALISGLSGTYLDEGGAGVLSSMGPPADFVGIQKAVSLSNTWLPTDDCHRAADALLTLWTAGHAAVAGEATWQEFDRCCQSVPFAGTATEVQAKRDLLKANFNPNSGLNKFNPDRSCWKTVDKSDLLVYSTEFSLSSLRPCDIDCSGRILDPAGHLLAQRALRASVSAPGILRLSTQKEFVCEDLGDLDLPKDETNPRLPGNALFVSESRSALGDRTWGHRLNAGGWLDGDSGGSSLQSYPEPCHDAGAGLAVLPADYDGRLALATVETRDDDVYGAASMSHPAVQDMKMLSRFTARMDLDLADAGDAGRPCQPDTALVTTAELGNGLLRRTRPSSLYPDGAYSELTRCPGYLDRKNAHGFHGLMSFWVKHNFMSVDATTSAPNGRGRFYLHRNNNTEGHPSHADQLFVMGFVCNQYSPMFPRMPTAIAHFDRGHTVGDTLGNEHQHQTRDTDVRGHLWTLTTLAWDFRAPDAARHGSLLVNEGVGMDLSNPTSYCNGTDDADISPTLASDITEDDFHGNNWGPHRIFLGRHGVPLAKSDRDWVGGGADSTFDEFAIWDFGGWALPPSPPWQRPDPTSFHPFDLGTCAQDLTRSRHRQGRYYKGSAYDGIPGPGNPPLDDQAASWLSGLLRLPAGSRILQVEWTFRRGSEACTSGDYAEIALASLNGDDYLAAEDVSRSTLGMGWTADRQRWNPNLILPGPFRLQAVFRRQTPVADTIPILDSPTLDDLTILYAPAGGSPLQAWESD